MEIEPMRWHNPVSRAATAAIHTYIRAAAAAAAAIHVHPRAAAAAAALKFHPKHVSNKNKAKHNMKIPHINIIYDKAATGQQISD